MKLEFRQAAIENGCDSHQFVRWPALYFSQSSFIDKYRLLASENGLSCVSKFASWTPDAN